MKEIKILDCTLREAPIKKYGEDNIIKTLEYLQHAAVDIIEVGFLVNFESKQGSTKFRYIEQVKPYLRKKSNNSLYVLCTQIYDTNYKEIPDSKNTGIDGIRIVFKRGELKKAIEAAHLMKAKGYKIFIQNRDTIVYSEEELIEILKEVNILEPYAYCMVDTYGVMHTEEVKKLYAIIEQHLSTNIYYGFHTHNNKQMASANVQEFIRLASNKYNIIIDASLKGCGLGAGNANIELVADYLNNYYGMHYNINYLFDAIENIIEKKISQSAIWGYSIPFFISAITDSVTTHSEYLYKKYNILNANEIRQIINLMEEKRKKIPDNSYTERTAKVYLRKKYGKNYMHKNELVKYKIKWEVISTSLKKIFNAIISKEQ